MLSSQFKADQSHLANRANQQLDEQSRLLTNILSNQSAQKDLLQVQDQNNRHSFGVENQSSDVTVRVKAYTPQQRLPCSPQYQCACHDMRVLQTPSLIHEVIGTLFLWYSGCCVRIVQRCTEADCKSQSTFRAYAHYAFPSWLFSRVVSLTLTSNFRSEINISLTVRRIMPHTAEVFRLTLLDDVPGLH